jgi:hypothetical protein
VVDEIGVEIGVEIILGAGIVEQSLLVVVVVEEEIIVVGG